MRARPCTLSATGSDPNGDSLTYAWDLDNNGSFETAGQSASFSGVDGPASFTVKVQATDPGGLTAINTATINVINVAPTVGAVTGPAAPVKIATTVTVSAPFTDPGILDTHTALVDWGDGTTAGGTVTESNGSGSVSATRSYAVPGVYPVTITVTDKDGGSSSSTFEFVVVYDPNGGFVTGGGWFTTTESSYKEVPAASGRTYIGFVSRYLPGQTVPSGSVRLAFHPGGLDFRSTALTWMGITSSTGTAEVRGEGLVNGVAGFTFRLIAVDGGKSDRLSLTIMSGGPLFTR